MLKVGLVGWRGMVGSVLLERMLAEGDLAEHHVSFFSTSQVGEAAPDCFSNQTSTLLDAYDAKHLATFDIIMTCQGGAYTESIYPQLRQLGWEGYWIDAASTLRMAEDSIIVLDPINAVSIGQGLAEGIRTFVGGNCTVSLLLLGLAGLFRANLVEWVSVMTYQAISGAGARAMQTLLAQGRHLDQLTSNGILALEQQFCAAMQTPEFPREGIGAPLAFNLLPWIDSPVEGGRTREEWKAAVEANKILQPQEPIPIDGTCVRVGALRSHSQAVTIKLQESIDLQAMEHLIKGAHEWIRWVPNDRETTMDSLTPVSVSGTLDIAVGRVRRSLIGPQYWNLFTVGDQLLWGAAEPLRRALKFILSHA